MYVGGQESFVEGIGRQTLLAILAALILASPSVNAAPVVPPGFMVQDAFPGATYTKPIQVVLLPDGRYLVVEKQGIIWVILSDGTQLATPFIDLTSEVLDIHEVGLMSAAVDPDFETNRWVYLAYTVDPNPGTPDLIEDSFSRVTRYQSDALDANIADLSTRQVLIGETWPEGIVSLGSSHTIGMLKFGTDKSLLISSGDGASFSVIDVGGLDPGGFGPGKTDATEDIGAFRARSLNSLAGKVLRIDKETGLGLASNPYWDGDPNSKQSRIWIYGLRNPYRVSLRDGTGATDPGLGDPGALYVGNTGWFQHNSVYAATGGGMNAGWPCREGPDSGPYATQDSTFTGNTNVVCSSPLNPENPALETDPVAWWSNSDPFQSNPTGWLGGTAITGEFYDGDSFPLEYDGRLFVADWLNGWIRTLTFDGADSLTQWSEFLSDGDGPVDMIVDPATGDLIYIAYNLSEIRRVKYLGDEVSFGTTGLCLSPTSTCVTVPVSINHLDARDIRSVSVTFQLSGNLELCNNGIVQGSWLAGFNNSFFTLDNGGGSYTVDQAILGDPCGNSAGGELFTIDLGGTAEGLGSITITEILLRDCINRPISVHATAPGYVSVDSTGPASITDLTSTQVKVGNDSDGDTKIQIQFTPPGDMASIEIYRAPYGNYPEYDDAPGSGSLPTIPAYPPGAPWQATALSDSGEFDEISARDVWHYVAYSRDSCGNVSAVSNMSDGTLNYHLGDVSTGESVCAGDNLVNTADVSFLGFFYGQTLGVSDSLGCLDVGPTVDISADARPTTDNVLNFEDLIIMSLNYNAVAAPVMLPDVAVLGSDEHGIMVSEEATKGSAIEARLWLHGSGNIQGLSARLKWNAAVVRPVHVEPTPWIGQRQGVVFSPAPGVVDVALLGARKIGLAGRGELAVIRFEVLQQGNADIEVESIDARDSQNRRVELETGGQQRIPFINLTSTPNPFRGHSNLEFFLTKSDRVQLSVFSVDGKRVRTLVRGKLEAGRHLIPWDATEDSGSLVSAGVYFARLVVGTRRESKTIILLK